MEIGVQSYKTVYQRNLRLKSGNQGNFLVRYISRVVIYYHRAFVRLTTRDKVRNLRVIVLL